MPPRGNLWEHLPQVQSSKPLAPYSQDWLQLRTTDHFVLDHAEPALSALFKGTALVPGSILTKGTLAEADAFLSRPNFKKPRKLWMCSDFFHHCALSQLEYSNHEDDSDSNSPKPVDHSLKARCCLVESLNLRSVFDSHYDCVSQSLLFNDAALRHDQTFWCLYAIPVWHGSLSLIDRWTFPTYIPKTGLHHNVLMRCLTGGFTAVLITALGLSPNCCSEAKVARSLLFGDDSALVRRELDEDESATPFDTGRTSNHEPLLNTAHYCKVHPTSYWWHAGALEKFGSPVVFEQRETTAMSAHTKRPNGGRVMVVDAGGGTIDISSYGKSGPDSKSFEEVAAPQCKLRGSIFVTLRARAYLEGNLGLAKYQVWGVPYCTPSFLSTLSYAGVPQWIPGSPSQLSILDLLLRRPSGLAKPRREAWIFPISPQLRNCISQGIRTLQQLGSCKEVLKLTLVRMARGRSNHLNPKARASRGHQDRQDPVVLPALCRKSPKKDLDEPSALPSREWLTIQIYKTKEECHLLREEMRRVKTYFKYRADEWLALAGSSYSAEDEGRRAYAAKLRRYYHKHPQRSHYYMYSPKNLLKLKDNTQSAPQYKEAESVSDVATPDEEHNSKQARVEESGGEKNDAEEEYGDQAMAKGGRGRLIWTSRQYS
ncbi:hypothetical protein BDN72DRAFT_863659 [Pluteus cervinus]|uniref:Uncharacterized protein n=1 Tax=Pluteus cervinus TaxID=181527 RepID=A0ACD3A7I5_9AGAR|nr:hypothetical protein BDN72DRAFT_863659 [Pluteus cervinus]